jgi:hypothetical protein
MASIAEFFDSLTVNDFVTEAFAQPVGGIFAGVGTAHAMADQAARTKAKAAGEIPPESYVRARIVPVGAGKVMVRWCKSSALGSFAHAAGGLWWSSDGIADRIVRETVRKHGPSGDSGQVARVVSAVRHDWSDLGGVVVVRTTRPVRVMVGFGRPVMTSLPGSGDAMWLGDGKDLQFMMITRPGGGPFRGQEFLQQLFLGSSTAFTAWWTANNPVAERRAGTIAAAAGSTVGGGYPAGVVRVT